MTRSQFSFSVLLLLLCASGVLAQDTTGVRRDTTVIPVMADSVRPIPHMPRHAAQPASGFSDGVWFWDREAFQLEAAITLADLLELLPGVTTFQSGLYLQPEAAAAVGGTAHRVEVWLDGYVLDPLLESSFDLSKLELANIESLRIERRMGRLRIHIETLAPKDTRAYSLVEAGVSQPDANLFRGVFLTPKLFFGPLGLAIDRIDTDGSRGSEPADQFAGWAKWAFIRKNFGVQAQFRRMSTDRDPQVPWAAKYQRDDFIISARANLAKGLVAEVFGGRSNLEVDTVSTVADNDSVPRVSEDNMQFGARASFNSTAFWADASMRLRDSEQLPSAQLDGSAGVRFGVLSGAAEITQSSWRDAGSALELTLRAQAGPFAGFRVFGEATTSDRGVPYTSGFADTTDVVLTSYEGYRLGAELQWRGLTAGAALLKMKADSVRPFGLPFDRQFNRFYHGGDATGIEVGGRAPIPFIKGLFATGSLTYWSEGNIWIYVPVRSYRAGAELHTMPLRSGNLEVLGRLEFVYRGLMLAPNEPTAETESDLRQLPGVNTLDGYLQIRIMDVRAFMRWEDLTGQDAFNLPDRPIQGPRLIYGVKWQFFN